MKINNIKKACAIGIDKFEKYDHKKFIHECKKYKNLIPIAGFNPIQTKENIIKEVKLIKKLGFKGVKLHPRISNFSLTDKKLIHTLQILNANNLIIFLCTYPNFKKDNIFFNQLTTLLSKLKKFKIILVHGGLTKVLEYSELVRSYPNQLLLDLSITISKYEASSVDNDLFFLFKKFDERICVGSDFPEINLTRLRNRFNYFSKNLNQKKSHNIAYKNLDKFLKM